MTVKIEKSNAAGVISAPPSKSAAHRALICGALSQKSIIENIEYSNDILATLDCLEALGATVERGVNRVTLGGLNPFLSKNATLDCRESGSTLRFLIPLCMLSGEKITLTGSERLYARNLEIYEQIASDNDILFEKGINSLTVCGKLKNGSYKVAGNIQVSSYQGCFSHCLCFAATAQ